VKIKWTANALEQLDRGHAFYADVDRKLAARVFRTIHESVRPLARFPASGRPGVVPQTREIVVSGFPFLVVYRLAAYEVEILRVLHTSTDWQAGGQ
jgi:toxin ParE1/3/4